MSSEYPPVTVVSSDPGFDLFDVSTNLRRDKASVDAWLASGPKCASRKIKCPLIEDYLFSILAARYGQDRALFDAARLEVALKRPAAGARVKSEAHSSSLSGLSSQLLSREPVGVSDSSDGRAIASVSDLGATDAIDTILAASAFSLNSTTPVRTQDPLIETASAQTLVQDPIVCPTSSPVLSVLPVDMMDTDAPAVPHAQFKENPGRDVNMELSVPVSYMDQEVQTEALYLPDALALAARSTRPALDIENLDPVALKGLVKAYDDRFTAIESGSPVYYTLHTFNFLICSLCTQQLERIRYRFPDRISRSKGGLRRRPQGSFSVLTALSVARVRLMEPMPTQSKELSDVSRLIDRVELLLSCMLVDLDACRRFDPSLFAEPDPTIADFDLY
ncbi:hypothetical protein C8J57DRAFT_1527031 [Mycena rebaudengoi]|nr:hypothetical protein C8J57DRAFT_1527031 [Mycena rebaudengoi]